MTSAEPPNRPSKLRTTGYGFIGVGAVAAVLGVSSLASAGPSEQEAAPAPDSPSVGGPGGDTSQPPSDGNGNDSSGDATGDPGTPPGGSQDGSAGESPGQDPNEDDNNSADDSSGNGGDSASGSPDSGDSAGDSSGNGGDSAGTQTTPPDAQANGVPVRILNNSKVHGLADEAGSDFRHAGYDVTEVGNYARGVVPNTTAYFRPGTPEQDQAKRIARQFDTLVQPRGEGLAGGDPGVIVIVTKDYND